MDTYLIRHYSSGRHGELLDSADGYELAMEIAHRYARNNEAVAIWTREGKCFAIYLPDKHRNCVAWTDDKECLDDAALSQYYAHHPVN